MNQNKDAVAAKKYPSLAFQIVIGMAAGIVLGMAIGPKAASLGELGMLVIQVIKAAAAPLLFLAIVNAIVKADVTLTSGLRMIFVAAFNACIALAIGLGISNLFKPGHFLPFAVTGSVSAQSPLIGSQKIDLLDTLASYLPASFAGPFTENAIIPIVILALLLGFGLRKVKNKQAAQNFSSHKSLEDFMAALYEVIETILGWIIRLVPLAVFGAVAKAVGQHGFSPFKGLGIYAGLVLLGFFIHVAVTYQLWLVFFVRINLKRFWREAKEPAVYSFGANSSLATLPLTLKSLDNLGVSRASSALGACVGTNLNNDGIILYEAATVLFVAQAHGLDLSLSQQIIAALFCLIAAMGVAGVPEAGFISLSLVLTTVGLPMEILPLLLTVDWLLARCRSIVNVLSDMLISMILDAWSKKAFSKALS